MIAQTSTNHTVQWWLLTLQGITAILFGIAAVFWPGLTLATLVYIFSAYIVAAGLISLLDSFMNIGKHQAWILTMALGLVQLAVGVYLLRNPIVSFQVIILLLGFSFIINGVIEAVSALAANHSSTTRTLHIISAALYVIVGVYILVQPLNGSIAFVWVLGLVALFNGPMAIALSMDIKKMQELEA